MFEAEEIAQGGEPVSPPVLDITYYTDPLCCWSWGFEPQWRLLRSLYAGHLAWRVRMGGMILDWRGYDDPVNVVNRPAQMGPLWMEASRVTGMAMDPAIWRDDPPASSWPACRAFKAAERQSAFAGDLYLRHLRRAVMLEGRNIARPEVLRDMARTCAEIAPERFDAERFEADLEGTDAAKAFEEDVRAARPLRISRFPALILHLPDRPAKILTGWRPSQALVTELHAFAPELRSLPPPSHATALALWPELTDREREEFRSFFGTNEE